MMNKKHKHLFSILNFDDPNVILDVIMGGVLGGTIIVGGKGWVIFVWVFSVTSMELVDL